LEEIRTTGVILDPFLSAKINEATNKLQVASAELANNETRLNDLVSKLEAANEREKNQEEESEKMYTDVEVMC
jgi:septal ring factor EnvC (AmiA/AmiB activator)